MHARVAAARFAEDLGRAIREDLVRIHVMRRPRARLIHVHHELIAQAARENFVRRSGDRNGDVGRQPAERGDSLLPQPS